MAEQFDKIIQDGRTSFVPRSNKTRAFWTKYNSKIAGSEKAARETVTIVPATEEEVKEWLKDGAPTSAKPVLVPAPTASVAASEIEELKRAVALQQELINKLLLGKEEEPEPAKEKGKPGPKPKNNNDGEGEQTENAKA